MLQAGSCRSLARIAKHLNWLPRSSQCFEGVGSPRRAARSQRRVRPAEADLEGPLVLVPGYGYGGSIQSGAGQYLGTIAVTATGSSNSRRPQLPPLVSSSRFSRPTPDRASARAHRSAPNLAPNLGFTSTKNAPAASNDPDSGRTGRSVEPLHDWTIDREVGGSKFRAPRACQQAILYESKDLEFFSNLAALALVDCVRRPFEQLGVPGRAVI